MTDHTIKAAMKAEGFSNVGPKRPNEGDLMKRIAQASRDMEQRSCVDEHERFAYRFLGVLNIIGEAQSAAIRRLTPQEERKAAVEQQAGALGASMRAGDGVALDSIEHPTGPDTSLEPGDVNPKSLETLEHEFDEPPMPPIPGVEDDPR